jgi:bifunctional non-homologous end joining protein LigD
VTWSEVEKCLKRKNAELLKFRSDQVLARMEKLGDLFEPVENLKQKPPRKWKL